MLPFTPGVAKSVSCFFTCASQPDVTLCLGLLQLEMCTNSKKSLQGSKGEKNEKCVGEEVEKDID